MTIERCFLCGEQTGRAGKQDESIYRDGKGPFCPDCWDKLYGWEEALRPSHKGKQKTIYWAAGRNGNTEEAVVIADTVNEALSLLGSSPSCNPTGNTSWSIEMLGTATDGQSEEGSDVISRVDANACRSIPHDAVCFFKDGNKWCCVFGDFIDLQQSPSGFGDTFDEALDNLNKDRSKVESVPIVRVDKGGTASVV